MKISDLVWDWVTHKEVQEVLRLFEFGKSLEYLGSDIDRQAMIIEGDCPFITAWYGWRYTILEYRERLNNNSIQGYYEPALLQALEQVSIAFDLLTDEECAEGDLKILSMSGWCKIRSLVSLPLKIIEWDEIKNYELEIEKML